VGSAEAIEWCCAGIKDVVEGDMAPVSGCFSTVHGHSNPKKSSRARAGSYDEKASK
jgi:hypothetical protein